MLDLQRMTGAILDLDGTLIDSMGIWHEIDVKFFAEHNLTPPKNLSSVVNKMTMEEWADFFIEEFHISMTSEQIIQRIEELCFEHYEKYIPLKPHVLEFLDLLDRCHIPYGIATATYRKAAEAALKRLNIFDRMKFILTAEEIPSAKKTPEMYYKAAELLNSSPLRTLVVEDSLHCIETAFVENFPTIAIFDKLTPLHEQVEMDRLAIISGKNFQEIMEQIVQAEE